MLHFQLHARLNTPLMTVYETNHEERAVGFYSIKCRLPIRKFVCIFPARYPDDPFDRIWDSDSLEKPNYLVAVADGIIKVSTERPIDAGFGENPPQKVMQTAVVGTNGLLSYHLKLNSFPGNGWVISYFAEVEDLGPNESRKFRMAIPFASLPDTDRPLVNVLENAGGKYRLYEHQFVNMSLPFLLSFEFSESPNSSEGPLLNAIEISKYLEITGGSPDGKCIFEFFFCKKQSFDREIN